MLWLILSVLIWGLVHSFLASLGVKNRIGSLIGDRGMRFYRLGYNLFSALSFIPIVWIFAILPDKTLYRLPAPWSYLFLAGQAGALILLLIGVLQTDTLSFIGLRQLLEGQERPAELVTHGLYRYVRHPLYTAGLLFIWLTPVMSVKALVLFVALSVYIAVGAVFEERKLTREFGLAYVEYRAVTPMLIPGLKFKRNK
ncbi:MAG: isoprenylcysteine carboxylmethyltransferase family protein [Anaerolineales bacterium]